MAKMTGVRKRIQAREFVDNSAMEKYRHAFNYFDTSGDGSISSKELDNLLRKLGLVLPPYKAPLLGSEERHHIPKFCKHSKIFDFCYFI